MAGDLGDLIKPLFEPALYWLDQQQPDAEQQRRYNDDQRRAEDEIIKRERQQAPGQCSPADPLWQQACAQR